MHQDNILYTKYGFRLRNISQNTGLKTQQYNWLFIPGGPGMGSEYLEDFVNKLDLPGKTWLCDYSGDGSNCLHNKEIDYAKEWPLGLKDAIEQLEDVVLVCHSFGGFLTLSTPDIESTLSGLIILSSAPNQKYAHDLENQRIKYSLPDNTRIFLEYMNDSNNETLKNFFYASIPYLFSEGYYEHGALLLKDLPYNYKTYNWSRNYMSSNSMLPEWYPKKLHTAIITGENDYLIPIKWFKENEYFNRENITMHEIQGAGHFPWIENFQDTKQAIYDFIKTVSQHHKTEETLKIKASKT